MYIKNNFRFILTSIMRSNTELVLEKMNEEIKNSIDSSSFESLLVVFLVLGSALMLVSVIGFISVCFGNRTFLIIHEILFILLFIFHLVLFVIVMLKTSAIKAKWERQLDHNVVSFSINQFFI